jgi:hypothetical protein
MTKLHLAFLVAASMVVAACGGAGTEIATVSAASLGAFDVSLYGWDALINAGKVTPGSPQAARIAKDGRAALAGFELAHVARQTAAPDPAIDALYEKVVAHADATFSRLDPSPPG